MKNSRPLRFHKYYPGGNPTILVENFDGLIHRDSYGELSGRLMSSAYVGAEQVGFLETPGQAAAAGRLHMMGGELCVNALRCVAHYLAEQQGDGDFRVETSGTDRLVDITADRGDMTVRLPGNFTLKPLSDQAFIVFLPGIAHFVTHCRKLPGQQAAAAEFAALRRQHRDDLQNQAAVGMIYLNWDGAAANILPIIYVTASDTLVTETSCGSGSMAALFVLSHQYGCVQSAVMQPSGVPLQLKLVDNDMQLTGPVQKTVAGELYMAV